jgi:hypothetical protein
MHFAMSLQTVYKILTGLDTFLQSVPHYTFQALLERVWYLYQHYEYTAFPPQDFQRLVQDVEQLVHKEMTTSLVSRYCTAYSTQLRISSLDSAFCDLALVFLN